MANFKMSFDKTIRFEGGYANHPNDKGGETYKGIARKMWAEWKGWLIVDKHKSGVHSSKQINGVLIGDLELNELVEAFYYKNFWTPIKGDMIESQEAADNIFDFAVNSGVSRAVRYAQRIVGAEEDGIIGKITISKINAYDDFVTEYKAARQSFVNKIVKNNPSQKVFLAGWTSRIANA